MSVIIRKKKWVQIINIKRDPNCWYTKPLHWKLPPSPPFPWFCFETSHCHVLLNGKLSTSSSSTHPKYDFFPLSKQETVPTFLHWARETEARELQRAECRSHGSSEATLPSPISPQSGTGWLSPPQGFQAVRTAMGSPWCEPYNGHTDLQQSLQMRADHPDPCLPTLRQAVPSTTQLSAQTCPHQPVPVTEIKGFNSPGCLFISRAWEAGDLCLYGQQRWEPTLWSQRQRGGVSLLVSLGLQYPPAILLPSPAPSSLNWNFSNPPAASKTSQTSSGWWCLPTLLHWHSPWPQPRGIQWEAGLARAGSRALLMLAQWGISRLEQEQQTWCSTRGFTTQQGFCQGYHRGPLWREHAVPDLPAVHLAQKTPSGAGLWFSSPSLRASRLFCEEKQQFIQ